MITYNTAEEVYSRNYGSERLYRRNYCNNLNYTEGLMDFQQTLNAYWIVDNVVSYMPKIMQAYKENELDFFVAEIVLNQNQQGYMEIYSEGCIGDEYNEHIQIIKQEIPFIDLPTKIDEKITSYKFFIQLSSLEPVTFTMLLTSEY